MPALFLTILKLLFLAFVYLFLWQVARAIGSHVGGGGLRRPRAGAEVVLVRSASQAGARLTVNRTVVMGRGSEADFLLDDPYASELHLRLSPHNGHVVLHDLGSTNGTYVNGRRVSTPMVLSQGDAVQVGKTIMEVR